MKVEKIAVFQWGCFFVGVLLLSFGFSVTRRPTIPPSQPVAVRRPLPHSPAEESKLDREIRIAEARLKREQNEYRKQQIANKKAAQEVKEEKKRPTTTYTVIEPTKSDSFDLDDLSKEPPYLEIFMRDLRNADPTGGIIDHVSTGLVAGEVKITVNNSWHIQPFQIRLQAAQNLWKDWALIRSPNDVDRARISLVDFNGNRVGGSGWMGGSIVGVDKD